MKTLLNSILSLLLNPIEQTSALNDPTVYLVETDGRKYCGKIIYQDGTVIRLQTARPKLVKILKMNIERITIVRNEAAQQYYQWQREKLQTWRVKTFHALP